MQIVIPSSNPSFVSSKYSKKRIKSLYEEWLMQRSQLLLEKKVRHYSGQLGVEPAQLIIKKLKNRWGSATKHNVINFNVNLLKCPSDVINYMILHELCHLKVSEHSHRFWDLIYKFIPNYKDKIDWLNKNADNLI